MEFWCTLRLGRVGVLHLMKFFMTPPCPVDPEGVSSWFLCTAWRKFFNGLTTWEEKIEGNYHLLGKGRQWEAMAKTHLASWRSRRWSQVCRICMLVIQRGAGTTSWMLAVPYSTHCLLIASCPVGISKRDMKSALSSSSINRNIYLLFHRSLSLPLPPVRPPKSQ